MRADLHDAADGIVTLDEHWKVESFSRSAERMFGMGAQELIGCKIDRLITATPRGEESSCLTLSPRAMAQTTGRFEGVACRKDGERFPVQVSLSEMVLGERPVVIAVLRDISEREAACQSGQLFDPKAAEDALRAAKEATEQASRTKTNFLANVSHEIRTPLNAILGVADLLWESTLDSDQRQYVSLFRRAGANLLVLVNDLLDLSKMETGQLELNKIPFDLREVVAQALESTSVSAYEKGLEMVGRVSPGVHHLVAGDPRRLRQILVNLLGNGVKFTTRGEIVLDVEPDPRSSAPGALLFSVRDTGIGIPEEKLDAIFNRFSQVDASSTRVHGGTGLGLTLCRALVEMMGGHIWADSELGVGTVFRFTVQLDVDHAGAARVARTTPPPSSRALERSPARALVVDDHATSRAVLAKILQQAGYAVTEVSTASAARRSIDEADGQGAPFDVVLADAKIRDSDGFDLLDWMRRTPNHARRCVVLLPGDAKASEMGAVRADGFACYLLKPVRFNRITAAVGLASRSAVHAPSLAPDPEPIVTRSLDVLLVEDHPDNRLIVQSYFKGSPHRLTIAENGEVAVQAFKQGSFDIVLMDMQMPVMDGYEATRTIREYERENGKKPTPILALTAHALNEEVERTKLAGCDAHLGKPIKKSTLLAALEEHASAAVLDEEALFAAIDPDLADLVPGYIQNRFRDLATCRELLQGGRFEEVRVLAHGMAGSGGAYGFDEITRLGRALQIAARGLDTHACKRLLDELDVYVRRIHLAFGQ
jgi:PAS domain S-box-containing protein